MMDKRVVALKTEDAGTKISTDSILNALGLAIVVIDAECTILSVNSAAEQFLQGGAQHLTGRSLAVVLPPDTPLFSAVKQVRDHGIAVSEYGVPLESPRIGRHFVNLQVTPLADDSELMVITLQQRSIADKIDRQLTHRGAARSVTAMAAMLAHEVKNPLSGIRGAAQLLEQNSSDDDRRLTELIRDEADRICDLVDRMDVFSDGGPVQRSAVNIHKVLDRVTQLAKSGFARKVHFVQDFDPSLPPVFGNHDQLVQVFLNLIKNAAEAVPEKGGEVTLETAYHHGVRFAVPGTTTRMHLPLRVSIIDNGAGIPDDIQSYLFDAFVTSKPKGSGLGLALVAKIIGDHGGVIEFESRPRRTEFRVMLPVVEPGTATDEEEGEGA